MALLTFLFSSVAIAESALLLNIVAVVTVKKTGLYCTAKHHDNRQ